jgi:ATP-dependent DNA ligase
MRRFRKKGKNNTLEWEVWVVKNQVHTESGVVGGKKQHTFDVPGPMGVANTKGFVTAEAQAILVAERKATKKIEEGYYEVDPRTNEVLSTTEDSITFEYLPKNLAFFKPQKWPDTKKGEEEFANILIGNRDIITVKRDGMMHAVLITKSRDVRIYTRRMDECTASYPHLVHAFKAMEFPKETVITCEFIVKTTDGRDDRDYMASIARSLPDRAVSLQQNGKKAEAVILGVPFLSGRPMFDDPVVNMAEFLENELKGLCTPYVSTIQILYAHFPIAKAYIYDKGLEGLVIYDGSAIFGEKAYNFRGTPERPSCWKWKPQYEDDFIIMFDPENSRGKWGSGKLKELPGNVLLAQYNKSQELVSICNCGTGFTEEERTDLLVRAKDNPHRIAGVAIIKYVQRGYRSKGHLSNALREPVFIGWHPDKTPEEVINPNL